VSYEYDVNTGFQRWVNPVCTCLAPGINYCEKHEIQGGLKAYAQKDVELTERLFNSLGGKKVTTYTDARGRDMIVASANATIERANRDIARAERRIALIEKIGEDIYEHEAVLLFNHRFSDVGRLYTYTAVKLGKWWFLSGPSQAQNKYDWGALVEFITSSVLLNDGDELTLWHASEWERVL
jgi:hypothetical protein